MNLDEGEKDIIRAEVSVKLSTGKPNFLIDTVADLPKVLKQIDALRLKSHYESAE
jgi:hypothetical protein